MMPLAIDLSDTLIRLLSLERHGKKWKIHVRAEIPAPTGMIDDGDIKKPADVSQLLRSLVNATEAHTKDVAITLPERHTFVKLISVPSEGGRNLDAAVRSAITQHIPYALDEVYWDWYNVPNNNSLGQPQALIGAAPKHTVEEYLHVFTQAGLQVDVAEIESLAIARAMFGPEPPDEARMIIDLGRTRSTLILVDHGIVQFSTTLRYAGREMNRFIADELHISDHQAERAKTLFGLDPKRGKGVLRAVLAPHIDAIATGIAEVEAFFQEHFVDHRPIQTIYLTGSGAMLRNIDRELQSRLDQPVVVEPSWIFQQVLQSHPDLPPELGFTYTTVFGLAARPWFNV